MREGVAGFDEGGQARPPELAPGCAQTRHAQPLATASPPACSPASQAHLPRLLSPPSRRSGWEPRVMWIGIGGSVFFTVLEQAKRFYAPKPPAQKPCCAGKKEGEAAKAK